MVETNSESSISSENIFETILQVTEGMDLVKQISEVRTRSDNPVTPIKMISVRVA